MKRLEACPHCHRHVEITESACPFCAHSLAEAFANAPPRVAPRIRLGRAATFAFGVGVAVTQAGCPEHGSAPPDAASVLDGNVNPTDGGPPGDALDGGDTPIYAAAPTDRPPQDTAKS